MKLVFDVKVLADAQGFFSGGNWRLPLTVGPMFTVTISGLDYPDGTPFSTPFTVDRRTCPDLPETGANSFPIGKTALGVSLAGAFLIVIALRRRPREDVRPAA